IARGFKDESGARRGGAPGLHVFDCLALIAPPGLFLGRVADFINGELLGGGDAGAGGAAARGAGRVPPEGGGGGGGGPGGSAGGGGGWRRCCMCLTAWR